MLGLTNVFAFLARELLDIISHFCVLLPVDGRHLLAASTVMLLHPFRLLNSCPASLNIDRPRLMLLLLDLQIPIVHITKVKKLYETGKNGTYLR